MNSIRKGLLFSFAGKYGVKLLNLLSTVLIARLLTPAEIGTFAIASSVVMILAEIRLLGAGVYLIREDSIDDQKIRKAYGMTLLMSWGIAFLLIIGSGSIANFFNQHDLQAVFIILASSFLLAPYVSIPHALLARNYHFKQITIISVVSVAIQLFITLLLIAAEFGFYALAWGQLASMVSRVVLSLYYTRHTTVYFPVFKGIGEIARLGLFTSASNIVQRIHYTASDIVIGKMGTPIEVGIFSRGMGYIDFISQSMLDGIGPISQPYMSEIKRRGHDIARSYINATVLLCSLVWPILLVAGFAALPAIRLLFGNQWDSAAPIASILAVWMCIKVTGFFSSPLLIAVGQETAMFKRDVILFILLLVSLIYCYPFGLVGMALAFLANAVVDVLITFCLLKLKIQLPLGSYLLALAKPLIVALCCLITTMLLDRLYSFSMGSPLLIFLLLAVCMPPLWLLLTRLLKLQIYNEVLHLLSAVGRRVMRRG